MWFEGKSLYLYKIAGAARGYDAVIVWRLLGTDKLVVFFFLRLPT